MEVQIQKPDKWIVVDNSNSAEHDWSVSQSLSFVEHHSIQGSHTIGALRNKCIELALKSGAEFIVFWDDDDYYPPLRIKTGVDALVSHPSIDIAASSHMYLLLTQENVFMEVGPYGNNHGTAATHTIRRRYAETHRFPDIVRGEELGFTNGWTTPMVQVPAEETIVVMGHSRNTVNKSDVYKTPHVFNGKVINDVNGKMILRTRWPVPWDLFRSTFVDGEYVRLRESIPKVPTHSVVCPTLRTGETEGFGERHV